MRFNPFNAAPMTPLPQTPFNPDLWFLPVPQTPLPPASFQPFQGVGVRLGAQQAIPVPVTPTISEIMAAQNSQAASGVSQPPPGSVSASGVGGHISD